ncbi:hypothetical protein J5N97_016000 [Dioscorea zingiberensis]|uniref:DNA/RNA-binding protein Alba-like domain-containing protein n=1 Tax=Dioscorea zingiberensis TaxID=325984 RepID=A0A9D5CL43_9LILI|nr:hypothetical protein J5N97_016000 [Dioscorea zingiberensis]
MKTLIVAELAEMDPAAVEVAVGQKMNRIQVSAFKKRTYFYVKLAKGRMRDYNEVELSGLGTAVGTVVKVAEILKNKGYATLKKILTSTIDSTNVKNGRIVRKSKVCSHELHYLRL